MEEQNKVLKLSKALTQGYTHFLMTSIPHSLSEFTVYKLSEEKLREMLKLADTEGEEFDENIYGALPYLCEKEAPYPVMDVKDLAELLADKFEMSDVFAPAVLERMHAQLPEDKNFQSLVIILNGILSDYKSYSDTDILVVLD